MNNIDEKIVFESYKFKKWKILIEANCVKINSIKVVSAIIRNGRLYSAFLDCELTFPEGHTLSRCILLRGDSVVIVPLIKCNGDEQIYTILVEQRRIVDGALSLEFPGGMIEENDSHFETALTETREELGIHLNKNELILLSKDPIKICTAVMDEKAYFYCFQKKVDEIFLKSYHNNKTGIIEDNEFLKLKVFKINEINGINNSNIAIAMNLIVYSKFNLEF